MGEQNKEWNMERREIINTKGLLKSHLEICYCGSFLNFIHIWKEIKLSHHIMGKTIPQLDIFCHQVKQLVSRKGYIFLSHWPQGSPRPLKTPQGIDKVIGYPSKLDGKAWLPKILLTCEVWRSWSGALLEASTLLTSVHNARSYSACSYRRKIIIKIT